MANKRMFTMKIVDSDAFLDMPLSTQCLYFHLNMRADDDGFIDKPKRIMKIVGASDDDLKLLIAKKFVLTFDNGVIVIKHWRMHNTLSQSRYHETSYTDEKSMLKLKENGSYSLENGEEINDEKLIEMSKRQSRRTKDEQKTNADLDLDLDKELDIDIDLETSKEKINKKESTDDLLERLLVEKNISEYLVAFVRDWISYKKERRFKYQETGLKSLLTEINNNSKKYGDVAVGSVIQKSIANGYQGICFQMLENANKDSNRNKWE